MASMLPINSFFQVVFVLNPDSPTGCGDVKNPGNMNMSESCEFLHRRISMMKQLSFLQNIVPVIYHGIHHSSHEVGPRSIFIKAGLNGCERTGDFERTHDFEWTRALQAT